MQLLSQAGHPERKVRASTKTEGSLADGAVHQVYAAKPSGPRDGQHQALYEVSIGLLSRHASSVNAVAAGLEDCGRPFLCYWQALPPPPPGGRAGHGKCLSSIRSL